MPTEQLLREETKQVELKQTARWDVSLERQDKLIEEIVCKTVGGFVNWLDTMLENALGHAGAHRVQIRIDVIAGTEVCRLDVPASSRPIWTKFKKKHAVLFERRNNSTREVSASEVDRFIADRFGPTQGAAS